MSQNSKTLGLLSLIPLTVGGAIAVTKYLYPDEDQPTQIEGNEIVDVSNSDDDFDLYDDLLQDFDDHDDGEFTDDDEVLELSPEEKEKREIRKAVSGISKENDFIIKYMQQDQTGQIDVRYLQKLVMNYSQMIGLMEIGDYEDDRVYSVKKKACMHFLNVAKAKISSPDFDAMVEEIVGIIKAGSPCSEEHFAVTKLKVENLNKHKGELVKAVEVINEHLTRISECGDIKKQDKSYAVKLICLKAKLYFEDENYAEAERFYSVALRLAADLQFDTSQIYADMASIYFALDNQNKHRAFVNHISTLEYGTDVQFRSAYLKTVSSKIIYNEKDCNLVITLKPKRSDIDNYIGICQISHTEEDLEITPISQSLKKENGSPYIVFTKEHMPLPEAGLYIDVTIDIFGEKELENLLGRHYQLIFVKGPTFRGSDISNRLSL